MLPPYPDRTLYLIPSATATIMWGKIINFSVCSFWKTIFSSFRDFFSFHEIFLIYCMLPPTACRTSFARINKACETYFSRTWFWFSSHIRTAALNWIEKSFWEFNFVFLPLECVCVCVCAFLWDDDDEKISSLFCIYRWGNYYLRLFVSSLLLSSNWLYDFSMNELLLDSFFIKNCYNQAHHLHRHVDEWNYI